MYRKYTITDAAGEKIEFVCHPEYSVHKYKDFIQMSRDEIHITLATRRVMLELVGVANRFMGGNTINKVEIEEVEE